MKKAFTLIELIFVIIIIGIIATVTLPSLNNNNLPKAAHQVIEHIRYTQHLAMVDDKFDSEPPVAGQGIWFKKRWRIMFSNAISAGGSWSYTIFDDRSGNATGPATSPEVAINPMNTSKKLSGGAAGGDLNVGDADVSKELNIGNQYAVEDIDFTNCGGQTVAFDYLGRPLIGALNAYVTAYGNLLTQQCVIDLCTVNPCPAGISDDKISIAIEPETGYTHIIP